MEKKSLENFTKLSQISDELNRRIGELEDTIDALDKNIDDAERMGLSKEFVDSLCRQRNDLDIIRIDLSLQENQISKALLEYQKIRLLTK